MKCFRSIKETKSRGRFLNFVRVKDVGRLLIPIIFMFVSFFTSSAQVVVKLGNDIAICAGDDAILLDFNPEVSGASGDKWWETSGDGVFNVNTIIYPNAVSYTPGSSDIANGQVVITLKARETNPNGDVYEDSAIAYIRGDISFACNDNITIPLNFHCEYQITPPMLLEGEDSNVPYTLYDVEVYDINGNVIPGGLITGDYIGQTLSYNITHKCNWNSCGGTINIRDNYHPIVSCGNDTITCQEDLLPDSLGFPIDTSIFSIDTIYRDALDSFKYIVVGWDACGDVILTYQDEEDIYECSDDLEYQQRIIRKWKAVDESGNTSRCNDTIMVERIPVSSVILPPNWNNVDSAALECDGEWLGSALPNGNPSPDYTGWPELWSCSGIEYRYEDSNFPGCGNTFDVIRKWTIIDWCNTDSTVHYNQVIKIMDTTPPEMECREDTVIVGADPYDCNSERYKIDVPDITDNCSGFAKFVKVFSNSTGQQVNVQNTGNDFYVNHLPLGFYDVQIKAIDDCNRISTCTYTFEVVDNVRPYMICDQHTKVNLGTTGEIRVEPSNIDDGSFDNCAIVYWDIRKMVGTCDPAYLEYGPYVGFCCEDANDTFMVEMRATDAAGNFNSCMVEVIVEDKLPPQIVCPPDILVSCDYYFNPDNMDKYFGEVVLDKYFREDIIIHDYYNNGVVGQDGWAYDNCGVEVSQVANFDSVNSCNIGFITRVFTAKDSGVRTNSCIQRITIENPEPFNYFGDDITWPTDTSFIGCSNIDADTSITGAPKVNDNMCSMVAMRYDDQLYSVQGDACQKVVRKWTVRDWCQDEAKWTHEQIIMVNNIVAPYFTSACNDTTICVYGNCRGQVELSASAEDACTPQEDLQWRWKLDLDGNGTYDDFGQGNHFSRTMDEGTYNIAWVVEDRCGNESICKYEFKVKDCKKPTPYCITDLTTVVMNQVGMVTMDVKKFDHGSVDNCTPTEDLKFSFSEDVTDTLFNITCDDLINGIARTFYLKMYVTDNANNQEYCNILLRVEGNGNCEETEGFSVGGLLTKWKDNSPVKGFSLKLGNSNSEFVEEEGTSDNGRYEFSGIGEADDYNVKPQDVKTGCLEGVSTIDIVLIQKHLLGIKKFNSPYMYLAADVNKSKTITASDILDIRKLILGSQTVYRKNQCWEYVDAKQQLNKSNVFTFKNELNYNNLSSSIDDADFKVIKLGDINGSFRSQPFSQGLEMRSDETDIIEMDNLEMTSGHDYKVPVYVTSKLEGLQFTVEFNINNIEFAGIDSGQAKLDDSNFGFQSIDEGILTFSWNTSSNNNYNISEPLFYINYIAKNNGFVAQNIAITSSVTNALSINNGEERSVILNYRNSDLESGFKVFQNTPNPFNESTVIKFNIPENEIVELDIYDLNGKLILKEVNRFKKGINEFKVSNSSFSSNGVYYYTIKVAGNTRTKKMILID